MRAAYRMISMRSTLILTAHGSADPRAAENAAAVAARISQLRPG
ncbi:MAG TPA: sirohydrochlorin chelatase, partial [Mycobacterium sp.]|nr:sirohydrochlorin chelatase [Mycobacterium sp.]